jgi:integrase
VLPADVIAMLETLERGSFRGLRNRAILLIGFAGGLRRSEIVGLDVGRDQIEDGLGWVEIFDRGMVVTLRGKTGWREIEVGRGSSDATCPLVALQSWLKLARIGHGPLFRRVTSTG